MMGQQQTMTAAGGALRRMILLLAVAAVGYGGDGGGVRIASVRAKQPGLGTAGRRLREQERVLHAGVLPLAELSLIAA